MSRRSLIGEALASAPPQAETPAVMGEGGTTPKPNFTNKRLEGFG